MPSVSEDEQIEGSRILQGSPSSAANLHPRLPAADDVLSLGTAGAVQLNRSAATFLRPGNEGIPARKKAIA